MTKKEKKIIADTIAEFKEAAEKISGAGLENLRDKENLLNRVDALEWVLSIAE